MLNLIREIDEKIQSRNHKKKEKLSQHNAVGSEIKEREQLLEAKEKEYKLSLDEGVLLEIGALKDEIGSLKKQQSLLLSSGALVNDVRYPYDKETVIQELDNKLKELNFEGLKDNIVKAQEGYIKSLEDYKEAVESLLKEKREIKTIENNVDIEVLRAIQNWFTAKYQGLHISSDLKVGNSNNNNHNKEAQLFDSIQDRVNRLEGFTGDKFESLK